MTGLLARLTGRRARLGGAALLWGLTFALVVDASVLQSPVASAVSGIGGWVLLVIGGGLAALAAGWRWWATRSYDTTSPADTTPTDQLPEAIAGESPAPLIGEGFDAALTAALSDPRRIEPIRADLRQLAIDALTQDGVTAADAEEAVDEGTWTEDPRAAAFLGAGIDRPLELRLRDWLQADHSTTRQVRHTLAAIEEVLETAHANDCPVGIFVGDKKGIERYIDDAAFLIYNSDVGLVTAHLNEVLSE